MSKSINFFVLVIFLCGCSVLYAQDKADLVIKNAKIVTIDRDNPRAQSVAIKGEFIIAVGSFGDIEQYIEEGKTKVIDAERRLIIPGFNDAHCHFDGIDPDYIDLRYITVPDIITEKVKEKVTVARPGQLIYGGRWDHELFPDKKWPTKKLIDPISPDNPVLLTRSDGHSVLVNTCLIEKSGITKDTPDPPGGQIQRDPRSGEPTGILKEKAKNLLKVDTEIGPLTEEQKQQQRTRQWQAAIDKAASLGVTSIQLPTGDFEMFEEFRDSGKLTLRASVGQPLPENQQQLEKLTELREKYPPENNWIRFGFLKGIIDGTLGSGTALLFDPFDDDPNTSGLALMPYEELERCIIAADRAGFQIGIHAIGDKANYWVLNAYERARRINGIGGSRHRIEHTQVLRSYDIPRFARLGVIASMQPTHCITDKRFAEKRLGLNRCTFAYAWRSLLDSRAKIAFGTDYPVEPLNPFEGLYAAVTRKDRAGETGLGWFPFQKLAMEEAIELYTLDSAYAEFTDDRKGCIKTGYLADMIILNQDLLVIPPQKILNTKVDYTIVGGKIVYQRRAAD